MKAKKSYGQHFLKEAGIAAKIAEGLIHLTQYKGILEVGPGMGMLTKYLIPIPDKHLIVCEADGDMVAYLEKHYPQLEGNIRHEDFLKADIDQWFGEPFAVIGNFPYNISSQIVFKVIEHRAHIPECVGMFQKEVAERLASPPGGGDYGILSILTQAYYHVEYLFGVKPGSFNPPPKVNSGVIRMTRYRTELPCNERLFKELVKTAFGQRRKMLRNTLGNYFSAEQMQENERFSLRPERLSVQDFIELAQLVAEQRLQNLGSPPTLPSSSITEIE